MANLSTTVFGKKLRNPFGIASGPIVQGIDNIIKGLRNWGFVVAKTIAPLGHQSVNVPRNFAPLPGGVSWGAGGGAFNCQGISTMTFDENLEIYDRVRQACPDEALAISIMAPVSNGSEQMWADMIGALVRFKPFFFEANHGCPQNTVEHGMGAVVGSTPAMLTNVTGWCTKLSKQHGVPIVAKLTPNVTSIADMAECAAGAGADGFTVCNTHQAAPGFNQASDDLEPFVSNAGHATLGAASGGQIFELSFRAAIQVAQRLKAKGHAGLPILASGGIRYGSTMHLKPEEKRTGGSAADYALVGCNLFQVYTLIHEDPETFDCVTRLCDEMGAFMDCHGFKSLDDFRGIRLDRFLGYEELLAKVALGKK